MHEGAAEPAQCGLDISPYEGPSQKVLPRLSPVRSSACSSLLQDKGKKLSIDLSVTVLTTGFWPTYKSIEVALPREMVEGVEVYRHYYDSDSKHRYEACHKVWCAFCRSAYCTTKQLFPMVF